MKKLPPAIPQESSLIPDGWTERWPVPDVFTEEKHRKMKAARGHFFKSPPPGQIELWEVVNCE